MIIAGNSSTGHDGATGDGQGGNSPATKLANSFDGINHRQHRLANGGNQFSVEPPDQGLCVGNGFVVAAVNDALRVYDKTGKPLTAVQDLNSFYGYPAMIDRKTGTVGPFVTDPSCLFDAATQRWFMTVLTLDVNPARAPTQPASGRCTACPCRTTVARAHPTTGAAANRTVLGTARASAITRTSAPTATAST
jgi:hypothetical protein